MKHVRKGSTRVPRQTDQVEIEYHFTGEDGKAKMTLCFDIRDLRAKMDDDESLKSFLSRAVAPAVEKFADYLDRHMVGDS